jgi:hypothetical protein
MKPTKVKLPANLGAAVDGLYVLQEKRDVAAAATEMLKKAVLAYKLAMINKFKKGELRAAAGKRALVTLVSEDVPTIEDFMKLWTYARKRNAPELFQKRLSTDAVRELWDAGKRVPGVGVFHNVYLQCRASKGKTKATEPKPKRGD